jgi:hypothetical protein
MTLGTRLLDRSTRAIRRVRRSVENRILVAEGRKAVRRKTRIATAVAKKAAKVGVVVGLAAAAAVVAGEIKKRRLRG